MLKELITCFFKFFFSDDFFLNQQINERVDFVIGILSDVMGFIHSMLEMRIL